MAGEAAALARQYADYAGGTEAQFAAGLESLCALLLKWNAVQNLVSRETVPQLWRRHIADSLQLLPLLPPDPRLILDLGSGGGFPALPLAVALKGSHTRLLLVEPVQKKASFLRTAIRELELPASVEVRRAEQIDSRETGVVDVITSRALAALPQLLALAAPFFGPRTVALLHKGQEHVEELRESGSAWSYDVVIHPSTTDLRGVLLEISQLRPRQEP